MKNIMTHKMNASKSVNENKVGPLRLVQSVLAAGLGVQSTANKERDFKHGKPAHFIVGGLLGTILFAGFIWLLVQFIIS